MSKIREINVKNTHTIEKKRLTFTEVSKLLKGEYTTSANLKERTLSREEASDLYEMSRKVVWDENIRLNAIAWDEIKKGKYAFTYLIAYKSRHEKMSRECMFVMATIKVELSPEESYYSLIEFPCKFINNLI